MGDSAVADRIERLRISSNLERLEGMGEEVTFHVTGYRHTKGGRRVRYKLELVACRFGVTEMLREFKKMQARDLERINGERARIQREQGEMTS